MYPYLYGHSDIKYQYLIFKYGSDIISSPVSPLIGYYMSVFYMTLFIVEAAINIFLFIISILIPQGNLYSRLKFLYNFFFPLTVGIIVDYFNIHKYKAQNVNK